MERNVNLPIIFLDRDGTIIKDKIYLNNPKEIKFYKDIFMSMKKLQLSGYKFVIVTNQSGIARGYVSRKNVILIHKKIREILKSKGIKIFKIYFCPHHPEEKCGCRKPAIGMVKNIISLIDKKKSFMIGDLPTDIEFGKNLGIKTILIKRKKLKNFSVKPDYIVKTFSSAAKKIISLEKKC